MLSKISTSLRSGRFVGIVLLGIVLCLALMPWWRNRGYVRDFFDYGVLIGGVGRLEQGQLPYTDFITPIQTSWYVFNRAVEKIAGGTFQGMTWSGAVSIVVGVVGLWLLLARRWPWWAAALLAGSLACASVSHHTVFWYNPWGVFLMVVAACAGAIAPVLKRQALGWNFVVGAALFLGGINKINIHLIAFALVLGWAGRAGLIGREHWCRVGVSWLFYGACALVFPVLAEMAWTGASFQLWWHNVLGQMAGDRAGMLLAALKWETYFKPAHDYYGPLRLPQIGLAGVVLSVLTVVAILRHLRGNGLWVDKVLALVCGVIAVVAGMVLLTTNMDIAYIALAGWIGLLVALWLGFGVPARGPWFLGALVVPVTLIGGVAWEAAWKGQRSQFGYSKAPRSEYIDAGRVGGPFAYFRGTHVSPEMFGAFESVRKWHDSLSPERREGVLYGPGSEWMAHIWPAPHTPNLPLYILGGWQFGPKEYDETYKVVNDSRYNEITVSHVLDHWRPELAKILRVKFTRLSLGEVFQRYRRAEGGQISDHPVIFCQMFGGTTDSRAISFTGRFFESIQGEESLFMGTTAGKEVMQIRQGANRLKGEVIVRRIGGENSEMLAAEFAISAVGGETLHFPRWRQRVELSPGQDAMAVEYEIDGSGLPTRFEVEVPPEFAGKVAAGWRGPAITHSHQPTSTQPLWIFHHKNGVQRLTPEQVDRILPANRNWTPSEVYLGGGQVTHEGLEMSPGSELWIRVEGVVTDFAGTAALIGDQPVATVPAIRAGWMLGARFELYTQIQLIPPQRSADFRTWSPEPGGWLVVVADPSIGVPPFKVRIDHFIRPD